MSVVFSIVLVSLGRNVCRSLLVSTENVDICLLNMVSLFNVKFILKSVLQRKASTGCLFFTPNVWRLGSECEISEISETS